jgi:hypothetical protein
MKLWHNTAHSEKNILHNTLKLSNKETKKRVKNTTSSSILYSDGNNEKNQSCPQQNHYLMENTFAILLYNTAIGLTVITNGSVAL